MQQTPFQMQDRHGRNFDDFVSSVYDYKKEKDISFDKGTIELLLFNVQCGITNASSVQIAARESDEKSRIFDDFAFFLPKKTIQKSTVRNIGELSYDVTDSELVEKRALILGQMFPMLSTNMLVMPGRKKERIIPSQRIKQNNYSLDKKGFAGFDDLNKAIYSMEEIFNVPQSELKNELIKMQGEKLKSIITHYFEKKDLDKNLKMFKEYISYMSHAPYTDTKQKINNVVYCFTSAFEKGAINVKDFVTGLGKELKNIKELYQTEISRPYSTEKQNKKAANLCLNLGKKAENGFQNAKSAFCLGDSQQELENKIKESAMVMRSLTYDKKGKETYMYNNRKALDVLCRI